MKQGIIHTILFCILCTSATGFIVPNPSLGKEAPRQLKDDTTNSVKNSHGSTKEKKNQYLLDEIEVQTQNLPNESLNLNRRSFLASTALLSSSVLLLEPANADESLSSLSTLTSSTTAVATSTTTTSTSTPPTFKEVMAKASKRAISGGKAGASASIVQVLSLMWLRTSMNYQYRYGGTLNSSLETLYKEGGIPRLYQGLPFALVQGPMTRFGDTAANVGILVLLDSVAWAQGMPLPLKTLCGSVAAGTWRIFLMPIDTSKTVMQVEGKEGLASLYDKVKESGPGPLYRGAFASAAATAVGHFPWFLTYNYLNEILPLIEGNGEKDSMLIFMKLGRSAFLGLVASCVSDCCSNSLRVIKTTKQTAGLNEVNAIKESDVVEVEVSGEISYIDAVKIILEKDGWAGLFGRGLQTRLLTNAIQGAAFSVLWRYFQEAGN